MPTEPIYDFNPLKEYLIRHGYQVGEANPFTPHSEDLDFEQFQNLEFVDANEGGGIQIKDARGRSYIGFLYKRSMYHIWQGEEADPKAHLCKCEVIESRGRDEYRFANSSPITYIDKSNRGRERSIEHLEICNYCLRILRSRGHMFRSTEDYINKVREKYGSVGQTDEVDVDINGYVRNWESISKKYREEHDYTCEQCGYKPSSILSRRFIQVHHINGDKTYNDASNLKCLCIKCHSQVDETHRSNFSSGANVHFLNEFNRVKKEESQDQI